MRSCFQEAGEMDSDGLAYTLVTCADFVICVHQWSATSPFGPSISISKISTTSILSLPTSLEFPSTLVPTQLDYCDALHSLALPLLHKPQKLVITKALSISLIPLYDINSPAFQSIPAILTRSSRPSKPSITLLLHSCLTSFMLASTPGASGCSPSLSNCRGESLQPLCAHPDIWIINLISNQNSPH